MSPVRITRRHLLALAAGGLLLPRAARGQGLGRTAVVIGAGVAGLSAAQIFTAEGATVIVIEARDRIGGRILTDRRWADCPADLGAEYIHGLDENPVVEIARDARLRMIRMPPVAPTYRYADGRLFTADDESAVGGMIARVDDVLADADTACTPDSAAIAIGNALPLRVVADPRDRLAMYETLEGPLGLDAVDISACHAGERDPLGGEDVMLQGGFDAIPAHLAEGIDVRLGVTVTAVRLTADRAVVDTSAGPIEADYVLVTVPLTVLKRGAIAFEPGLPQAHQDAIGRIGEGVLAKTFLRFPAPFWDPSPRIGRVAPESDGFFDFTNLDRLRKAPVLVASAVGSFGRKVEAMADADLMALLGETLRGLYGSATPLPEAITRAAWTADPLAGLAFSAPAVGIGPNDRTTLATPIERRIALAGEAAHATYPGTVHGACLSGIDAAQRLVRGT